MGLSDLASLFDEFTDAKGLTGQTAGPPDKPLDKSRWTLFLRARNKSLQFLKPTLLVSKIPLSYG